MRSLSILTVLAVLTLSGCASGSNPADPYESFNRGVYKFNDGLDRTVAKPLAQGYDKVMPSPAKTMVNNFFSNLDDVVVTANDLLQFKFKQAASDASRVLINSTFGIFGLINVASRLEKHNEDFGQTLGYWGLQPGPYLMLPILGPSTMRDGFGRVVDTVPSQSGKIKPVATRNSLYALNGVKTRAQLLEAEKVMDQTTLDRYQFIRDAYLQYRLNLVYDGDPPRPKYDDYEDYGDPDMPEVAPQSPPAETPLTPAQ
ncbi:MAG: VacJ family lipoprotein [Gallionella sp.]